jgi:hypothetical protein
MHHDPLDRTDLEKVSAIAQVYQYTYRVLEKIYGQKNLSEVFFPIKPEMDVLVCRHDVDEIEQFVDVFPVDEQMSQIRNQYGNVAKITKIRSDLEDN